MEIGSLGIVIVCTRIVYIMPWGIKYSDIKKLHGLGLTPLQFQPIQPCDHDMIVKMCDFIC